MRKTVSWKIGRKNSRTKEHDFRLYRSTCGYGYPDPQEYLNIGFYMDGRDYHVYLSELDVEALEHFCESFREWQAKHRKG